MNTTFPNPITIALWGALVLMPVATAIASWLLARLVTRLEDTVRDHDKRLTNQLVRIITIETRMHLRRTDTQPLPAGLPDQPPPE